MKEIMNKKEQTIYCILVVFVLLLLAFGDQIALKSLPNNPNPNDRIFGGGEKKENSYEFLNEITIQEVLQKVKNQENFYLIFLRPDCFTCSNILDIAQRVSNQILYPVYYINRDDYISSNEAFQTFLQLDNRILENESLTPIFIRIEKGIVVDTIVGVGKEHYLEDFLCKSI